MEPIGPIQLSPANNEKHPGGGMAGADIGICATAVGALLCAAALEGLATAIGPGALLCPVCGVTTAGFGAGVAGPV